MQEYHKRRRMRLDLKVQFKTLYRSLTYAEKKVKHCLSLLLTFPVSWGAARLYVAAIAISVLMLLGLKPAGASSANLSHSYQSTESIPNGSIVSLDPQHQGYVQLANTTNGSRILGVALASQDSLLAVDSGNAPIQVAIDGTVNTLVSNIEGNIKVGDQVSVSPFGGIGMEAVSGARVIGVAQTPFNQNTSGATVEAVKDKAGKVQQIKIGYVQLSISVGIAGNGGSGGGTQLNFLQKVLKSLTGRTISTIRIVLSIVVTLMALVSLMTLIHASIYGSLISIGRNPLARHAIFQTLTSVLVLAVLTIAIACVTVYYLLH